MAEKPQIRHLLTKSKGGLEKEQSTKGTARGKGGGGEREREREREMERFKKKKRKKKKNKSRLRGSSIELVFGLVGERV